MWAARGDKPRTSVLRNMYTQTLVRPTWDLACAIMEILGDFHTTNHLHFRLRIEKNTSRQTVRFCVRQTCTHISNTAFPSHLCAPQIKNHNSSLTVTTDHRTHTIVADQKKKEGANLVINCVPQKLNFYTHVRYQHFHGKYQPEPKKHTKTVNAQRSRHW